VTPELAPELARLDRILAHEVQRMRAGYVLSADEQRGLYVSDQQVDALLRGDAPTDAPEALPPQPPLAPEGRWADMLDLFALDPVERDLLLICTAPELHRKYATLLAYLNDDFALRWPTAELLARLIPPAAAVRRALLPEGRLRRFGLLQPVGAAADGQRRPDTAQELAAAPAVARWLAGLPPPLPEGARLLDPDPGDPMLLQPLAPLLESGARPLVLMQGEPGDARLEALRALAARLGGRPVLETDLDLARSPPEAVLEALALPAELTGAVVLLRGLGARTQDAGPRIATAIDRLPGPVFVMPEGDYPAPPPTGRPVLRLVWPEPDAALRTALWRRELALAGVEADAESVAVLAARFRLPPARIRDAARSAALSHRLDAERGRAVSAERLLAAARAQSGEALRHFATRVVPRLGWPDLVLPPATLARLRDVAAAIANRGLVQERWGMGRLSRAPDGLAVLFQGASGTGKTMAAGAVARELGLDLYRIDLAGVVSKYIGETEKNLDRIFAAARRSNAILFFDEADALFGKRSEVKDAHDRYANLEVAYLLQRMEEHDGPVVLASNHARNMDQAFARRLQFVVEFPRPDPSAREQLWRQMLAPPLPCCTELDIPFLSRAFELTGGEIRRTALEAAFMAAADGQLVTMGQLLRASQREMQRQGRLLAAGDLGAYGPLLAGAG
jgi:hypothetical protein